MGKVYKHKIKSGTYSKMASILRFSEQVEPYIDGGICRVTCSYPINELNLRESEVENYKNDILYSVEILEDKTVRTYLILESMLEDLKEYVIVE